MGFMDKLKGSMANMPDASQMMGTPADAAKLNAQGAEMRRLWAEGLDGQATVKDFTDTGERIAGNMVLDLHLTVAMGGDTYDTTFRTPIAGQDTSPYATGAQFGVKVDPANRDNLVFARG